MGGTSSTGGVEIIINGSPGNLRHLQLMMVESMGGVGRITIRRAKMAFYLVYRSIPRLSITSTVWTATHVK